MLWWKSPKYTIFIYREILPLELVGDTVLLNCQTFSLVATATESKSDGVCIAFNSKSHTADCNYPGLDRNAPD